MTGLITFQTLESDELVPLTTDLSDLVRTLSDLCIQAYQQLLSITEKRLQNIIGATRMKMMMLIMLSPPLHLLSYFLLPLSLSLSQSLHCWRARPSQVCLAPQ